MKDTLNLNELLTWEELKKEYTQWCIDTGVLSEDDAKYLCKGEAEPPITDGEDVTDGYDVPSDMFVTSFDFDQRVTCGLDNKRKNPSGRIVNFEYFSVDKNIYDEDGEPQDSEVIGYFLGIN